MSGEAILSAAAMRAAEEAAIADGTSVEALMERAGEGVARAARAFAGAMPALVLCGPGNNGGDGYVVARLLRALGQSVRVAALGEPRTPAALRARALWDGPVEPFAEAAPAPLLIDGLFGTGLSRGLDGPVADRLSVLAREARLRIAIDLPSGVATDDGRLLSSVPTYDLTAALGALKPAHLLQPAAAACGRVVVVPLGLGELASDLHLVARPALAPPGPADHKYKRGYVAVVAGAMTGAAELAAVAAQRAGAGYVALLDGGQGGPAALVRRTGLGTLDDLRVGAVVAGPGLGRDDAARDRLARVLACDRPLVLDADALVLLGEGARLDRAAILTPHEGEFATLFGTLSGSKVDRARAAARSVGAVVLLKGADTVIAAPDGRAAIARQAPAWLASAGTGDVLAGICGAMLARGLAPFEAACAGAWLHGSAACTAGPALIADDLLPALRSALA